MLQSILYMPRLEDTFQNRIKVAAFDAMKNYMDNYMDEEEYLENHGGYQTHERFMELVGDLIYIITHPEKYYQTSWLDSFITFNTYDNEYKIDAFDKMKQMYDNFIEYENQIFNQKQDSDKETKESISESSDDKNKDPDYVDETDEVDDEESNDEDLEEAEDDNESDSESEDDNDTSEGGDDSEDEQEETVENNIQYPDYETKRDQFILEFIDPVKRVPYRNNISQPFILGAFMGILSTVLVYKVW